MLQSTKSPSTSINWSTRKLDIAVVDPADKHYYQPAWTLVGGGVFDIQRTERSEASVMPKRVTWIKQKALGFSPEQNRVELENGPLDYDYLIVCPGIQLNWNAGVCISSSGRYCPGCIGGLF